jgi:Cdc6-like AAA superfamily ATPase
VTGPYTYDSSRTTYRNIRTIEWKKQGKWKEVSGPIVLKTLTDITKYPVYVEELKRLIGIDDPVPPDTDKLLPALNIILYGPPGTGKTYTLRQDYMKRFREIQMVTQGQFAQELASELTWLQVIAMVLYALGPSKVLDIFEHPILQAKIRLQATRTPKNTIWARLQRHSKIDCPNVKFAQRDEPQIFWKDEHAVWSVDQAALSEQLPELIDRLKMYQEFKPVAKEIKRYEYITFHQAYCYEDFVEGIKPVMSDEGSESLIYEVKTGIFRNMVNSALNDPDHVYAILIDEINRGNVASIFGELIALIEEDKRKDAPNELRAKLPYSREEFVVPRNLYIIGAMNTADRSVEALDTALRRRFTFIAVPPRPDLIEQPANLKVDLKKLLVTINGRIEKLLDKDHCMGHSYFMGITQNSNPLDELRNVFAMKIFPLLEEYFYGNPAKIGMVLGERFVKRNHDKITWASGDWGVEVFEERHIYSLQDPKGLQEEDFRSVYE